MHLIRIFNHERGGVKRSKPIGGGGDGWEGLKVYLLGTNRRGLMYYFKQTQFQNLSFLDFMFNKNFKKF